MYGTAVRRWAIPALVLTAALGGRAKADADATPLSPRVQWVGQSEDFIVRTPTTQPETVTEHTAPPAPEPIVDPLPPAFWSGLITIALCGALVSFRSVRQLLR